MENEGLRRSIAAMRQSLFDEGILDEQYFTELEDVTDISNFIEEVYLNDSTTLLPTFEQEMDKVPIDFSKMDGILCRLESSSNCIGAKKVLNEANKTRELLQKRNLEGAKVAYQALRNEHDILKTKLEPYLQQQRLAADLADTASPASSPASPPASSPVSPPASSPVSPPASSPDEAITPRQ